MSTIDLEGIERPYPQAAAEAMDWGLQHGLFSLVQTLRDHGYDPKAWREHLHREFSDIFELNLFGLLEIEKANSQVTSSQDVTSQDGISQDADLHNIGVVDAVPAFTGDSKESYERWRDFYSRINAGLLNSAVFSQFLSDLESQQCIAYTHDLVADAMAWQSSIDFAACIQDFGQRWLVIAGTALDYIPDRYLVCLMGRRASCKPFCTVELESIKNFLRTLGQMVGRSLASLNAPSPSNLPPRRKQVLELLLLGLTDEQISTILGLAKDTIRGHIKALFSDFRVNSRTELLAHCLRYMRSQPENLKLSRQDVKRTKKPHPFMIPLK